MFKDSSFKENLHFGLVLRPYPWSKLALSVRLGFLVPLFVVNPVSQAQGNALSFAADADVAKDFVLLVRLATALHAQIY